MYNIRTINQLYFSTLGYKMENKTKLYDLAVQARNNAYAPYSGFKVGAALCSADGSFFCGCNAENVSYPCGTCAEAGAISAMVAAGKYNIAEILIVADTEQILPCGNCLQKIAEFGNNNTIIYSADIKEHVKSFTLKDLLPHKFS